MHVTLADKPQQPAKSPRAAAPHADSLFGNAGDVDLTGQKEANWLTMTGNVKVESIRGDDAGHLLMQFNLNSTRLDYDIPPPNNRQCRSRGRFSYLTIAKPAPNPPDQPVMPTPRRRQWSRHDRR